MTTHTQTEAKSTSTLIPAMQPAHSSLLPQLELEEPDRSLLPTVDWLRSPSSPTPPPINPSVGHSFGSMAIGSTTTPVLQRMAIAGNNIVQRQENPKDDELVYLPVDHVERKVQLEALKRSVQNRREQRDKLKAKLDSLPKISRGNEEETRATLEEEKIVKDEIIAAENYLIEGLANEISTLDQAIKNIEKILPNQSKVGIPEVPPEVYTEITRLTADKKAAEQERLKILRARKRNEIRAIEEKLPHFTAGSKEREELEKSKKELGTYLSSTAANRTPPGTVGKDSSGRDYVVYQDEVKVGGKLPWLNNNPGNVTKASSAQGVIGFNPGGIGFVIFKDWESGVRASGKWWDVRKEKSPDDTIGNAILIYSQGLNRSPKALADAEEYTIQVESWTGLQRTRTLNSLSNEELASLKQAVLRKEGGLSNLNVGDTYTCDSSSAPLEYRRLLGCDD
jgi:hypothetical protein